MSTELTVYDRIADPTIFVEKMGRSIFRSGMFGCANEEQGTILAMACMVEQSNPVEIARVYHIIHGKLTMRADAMLAEFRKRGGKCKWESRVNDIEKARAQFVWEDHDSVEEYTKADAGREGLLGKDKYKTSLPDMLRARLVSKVVRMLAPEIVAGYYSPEELDGNSNGEAQAGPDGQIVDVKFNWPESAGATNGQPEKPQIDAKELMRQRAAERAAAAAAPTVSTAPAAAKKDVVPAKEPASKEAAHLSASGDGNEAAPPPAESSPSSATAESPADSPADSPFTKTLKRIDEYGPRAFGDEWPGAKAAALKNRGVGAMRSLSQEQADELLEKLMARSMGLEQANQAVREKNQAQGGPAKN